MNNIHALITCNVTVHVLKHSLACSTAPAERVLRVSHPYSLWHSNTLRHRWYNHSSNRDTLPDVIHIAGLELEFAT